ncbi:hypothetical protein [Sphingomonas xanthus]|uniref:hypothetical protein n=1 Tax=Sphingomonas xanthus TaxID=2594473 RepID=UPI00164CF29B|nr:hypothetical protein [Sphingomonas xanthus]
MQQWATRSLAGAGKIILDFALSPRCAGLSNVDDVLASSSTAEACGRALQRAGARQAELICWARVVRPGQLMR